MTTLLLQSSALFTLSILSLFTLIHYTLSLGSSNFSSFSSECCIFWHLSSNLWHRKRFIYLLWRDVMLSGTSVPEFWKNYLHNRRKGITYPDDWGSRFFWNVCTLVQNYTVSSNTGHQSNAVTVWQSEYQPPVCILFDAPAVSQIIYIRDFYGGKISHCDFLVIILCSSPETLLHKE
jgi:hypothetical protein